MHDRTQDITDKELSAAAEGKSAVVSPDQLLHNAREAKGLSVDEVAHDLHLEASVILTLESGDYAALGAPVFVRGYMRSYARLLGLSEKEVLAGMDDPVPESKEFISMSVASEEKLGTSMVTFSLWAGITLVVLSVLVYVSLDNDQASSGDADKGEFVTPVVNEVEVLPEQKPAAVEAIVEAPELVDSVVEPVIAAPDTVRLTLTFTDKCWVEVSDARNRLLYGMEKSGRSVSVEGIPPFRLFLGNVRGVALNVDGEDFVIPGSSLRGNNTARFVISEADLPGAEQ
jgi:cytoskeleton protein RodZ